MILASLLMAIGVSNVQRELEFAPFAELRRRVVSYIYLQMGHTIHAPRQAEGSAYPALLASDLETLEREGRLTDEELEFLRVGAVNMVGGERTIHHAIIFNVTCDLRSQLDRRR